MCKDYYFQTLRAFFPKKDWINNRLRMPLDIFQLRYILSPTPLSLIGKIETRTRLLKSSAISERVFNLGNSFLVNKQNLAFKSGTLCPL